MQANLIYFSVEHKYNLDCCMCLIPENETNNTNYEEIKKQNDIIKIICLNKERSSGGLMLYGEKLIGFHFGNNNRKGKIEWK